MVEERLQIAREMHDVIGHSLAVISLQAGVAEHLLASRPEEAREAVAAIRGVSKQALTELRSELAALRGERALRVRIAGRRPDFRRYRHWRRRCATRDCRIDLDLPEGGDKVPEIVSTAAYRIVQESLTDVARHAGTATRASVRAVLEARRLELEIVDDGIGARVSRSAMAAASRGCASAPRHWQARSQRADVPKGIPRMGIAATGGTMSIRVVLADDQALIRVGLRPAPTRSPTSRWLARPLRCRKRWTLCVRCEPDVVVMDIRMPVLDGLEATRLIATDPQLSGVRVLVLTTFEIDEYVFEALRAGAGGFLLKDAEPTELLRAIRVVAAGDSLLSPAVTRRVIEAFSARPAPVAPRTKLLVTLADREREVVALAGCGLSNDEIAERLVISPATARTHVSRSMQKLGARDRAQLVVFAYETGLVSPGQAPA